MLLRANGNLFTCKVYCFHMLYILLLCIQELSSFENTPLLVSLRFYRLFLLHALPLAACPWGYLGLGIMPLGVTLALASCPWGLPWPWMHMLALGEFLFGCLGHGSVHALALAVCPWWRALALAVACFGLGCMPNGATLALAACPWGLAHFQNVLKSDHRSPFRQ